MQTVRIKLNPDYKPGTALKKAIAKVVDAAPLPAKVKQAIKSCGGCAGRAAAMDKAYLRLKSRNAQKNKPSAPDAAGSGSLPAQS